MKSTKKQPSRVFSTTSSKHPLKADAVPKRSSVSKQLRLNIWPEWNDGDLNNEKWEGTVKPKDKSRTSCQTFEDTEKNYLSDQMKQNVVSWNKPSEFMGKSPVLVDPSSYYKIDLSRNNDHIYHFEIIRHIICEISFLWSLSRQPNACNVDPSFQCYILPDFSYHVWRPWEHIYTINKVTRGPNICPYNPYGKYCVKLFWMGCWRKITVDDYIPLDQNNFPLLVSSTHGNELWPLLLSKALMKIAMLDMKNGQIGDFSAIQCLTGWVPESVPMWHAQHEAIWGLLKKSLKTFRWETEEQEEICSTNQESHPEPKESLSKLKKKDDKKKDKQPKRESPTEEDIFADLSPVVVTGRYKHPNYPFNMTDLQQMTQVSIKMRKIGFSQSNPHPVLLQKTRDVPLLPPPVEPEVPSWKLIRPRRVSAPSSVLTVHPKFILVMTPYSNFRINSANTCADPVSVDTQESVEDKTEEKPHHIKPETDSATNRRTKLNASNKVPKSSKSTHSDKPKRLSAEEARQSKKNRSKESEDTFIIQEDLKSTLVSTWVEFSDFYECFRYLNIYHRPQAYTYNNKHSFVRIQQQLSGKDKKSQSLQTLLPDEKAPLFILSDSSEKIELVISLTCFTVMEGSFPQSVTPISEHESESNIEEGDKAEIDCHAQLVVEPHSWRNIESTSAPLLVLRTAGTKSEMLILPKGRHVLKCMSSSTYGYHLQVLSNTPFSLVDEDALMGKLGKESACFLESSVNFVKQFILCLSLWNDQSRLKDEWRIFHRLHCPYSNLKEASIDGYFDTFYSIFMKEITSIIGDNQMESSRNAIRALILNFSAKYVQKEDKSSATSSVSESKPATKGGKKNVKTEKTAKKSRRLSHTIWSPASLILIVKLQSYLRGRLVRKALESRKSDNSLFGECRKKLSDLSLILENNTEKLGLNVFRALLSEYPALSRYFPFNFGEWNQVAYHDYTGMYADQPPNSRFLLFRGVFNVNREILVVPKLWAGFSSCRLKVIDNDSGCEISRVFDKVSPFLYRPNKKGYTFLGEGITKDSNLSSGKWKLRLIGEHSGLPTSEKNDVNHNFYVREILDYYVPLDSCVFAHYRVRVFEEHMVTVYAETSHPEIPILLEAMDGETVLFHSKGIGFATIPAIIFLKNTEDSHDYSLRVSALNHDWPMSAQDEEFVDNLRFLDSNELKIHMKGDTTLLDRSSAKSKRKEKSKTENTSEYFDKTKPHWILRIISSAYKHDDIEVIKYLNRNDRLKSMKKAWEDADPGRYIKAVNTRLGYYRDNNILKDSGDEPPPAEVLLQECIGKAKDQLKGIEIEEKKCLESSLMLTDELIDDLIGQKEINLQQFNEWHEKIRELRQKERLERDATMAVHMKELREMQKEVDRMHNETERAIFMLREQKIGQAMRAVTPDSSTSKRKGSKKSPKRNK